MKYAVLIDSENARPALDEVFEEISKYGDTPIRILVGDFTSSQVSPWKEVIMKHAISCLQTMNYTNGKNSLDISLVIEGMKILYEKSYIDGIVIVASDSDYTPLCREWRSLGKDVIGIGRSDSPESYRASCTKFIYTENIYAKENKQNARIPFPRIKSQVISIINANNGKCQMSLVCETLLKAYSDFDVRSYGYSKSIDFFRGEFQELNVTEDIKNTYFLSIKDSKNGVKPEPKKKENAEEAADKKNQHLREIARRIAEPEYKKKKDAKSYRKPRREPVASKSPKIAKVEREEIDDILDL